MNWATRAIEKLKSGQQAKIQPRGNSMTPLVVSGAEVTLAPILSPALLKSGDIVLVSVGGRTYLHLISATDNDRVQISNNKGRVNGWVARERVYGIAVSIDNGIVGR